MQRSRAFRWLVGAGFLARGLTYAVIAALAGALALGAGIHPDGASPNQEGALRLIGQAPLGRVALGFIALGLAGYAIWKLGQGVFGSGPEGGGGHGLKDRAGNLGGAVAYLAFSAVAARTLLGTAGNGSSEQRHAATGVLGWPGGPWLVGAAGAALIAISASQIYDAIRGKFAEDNKVGEMSSEEHKVFLVFGRAGLSARSLVFALAGYFVIKTAIEFRASGIGVDGTLAEVHHQPLGMVLLALVAAGLLIFAAFSIFEARYHRL